MRELLAILALCCGLMLNAQDNKQGTFEREDYRFAVSFGTDSEGNIGRVIVCGYTPQSDSPVIEYEHELVMRLDKLPDADEAAAYVDDKTDINFDGIPDLMFSSAAMSWDAFRSTMPAMCGTTSTSALP